MPRFRPGRAAAQAEQEHGITDAIKLASNESPWEPVPAIVEAVEQAARGINRYADHRATVLRERLATWLSVSFERVTVGAGSVTLLQQLYLSYVGPGDEIVFPWPSFEVYPLFARLAEARTVEVPLVDHGVDVDGLAGAVSPASKFVLLANPNNPTSTAVPVTALARLLDRVDPDTLVVVDEAYREFADPALGDPLDLLADHDNLVVVRTFSKAQSLAGLRLGYCVAHPDVVGALDATAVPFAVNALAQAAGVAAMEAEDEIAARAAVVVAERQRVLDELSRRDLAAPSSQTNFVWLPLGSDTDRVHLELERRGVVTRPFSEVGVRVTIGTADENERFLRALDEALS